MAFAPTYGFPGGDNTNIPLLELSGNLLVEYGRSLKRLINRVVRRTPVKKAVGAYLHFDPLSLARLNNRPQGNKWAPGTLRPTGFQNTLGFTTRTFRTERYDYPCTLDKRAIDQANWPILKNHTEMVAQTAETDQWLTVVGKLFDTGNFPSTHTDTATNLNGQGFTQSGTTADPRIKNTLDAASAVIQKNTMGRVRWGNLSCLINHNTARRWSQTREIREYTMQQVNAYKNITGEKDPNYNEAYSLPSRLYNYNLVIDDVYYNPYNEGSSSAVGTVAVPDNKALVFLAEGDLEQAEGTASFNTCHVFEYEAWTVESKDDGWNRIVDMHVVMDYDTQIVAPATGFVITGLFS
jgi:hypothetical protein